MKARSVNESVEFKRGVESKEGLDVGIQRSDNPNNLKDFESFLVGQSNGEFLEDQLEKLQEFHRAVNSDLAPMDDQGQIVMPDQQKAEKLSLLMLKIEHAYDDLLEFLKSQKI